MGAANNARIAKAVKHMLLLQGIVDLGIGARLAQLLNNATIAIQPKLARKFLRRRRYDSKIRPDTSAVDQPAEDQPPQAWARQHSACQLV